MKIPQLRIGPFTVDYPIIQGAMGVRVSLSSLAAAVTNAGAIGTIASVGLGDIEASKYEYERMSREALAEEIRKAKSLTAGPVAVNVMGVLSNADDLIKTAVDEGVEMIAFGAGLPLRLPQQTGDSPVCLLPIVSSGRAARLILQCWDKRYGRTADGIILEGPLAGGHLGFSYEQLQQPGSVALEILLPDVLDAIRPYQDKYGRKIPVVAGGGIYDGKDIVRMLSLGAAGVQMATRFVCTAECGVSPQFKQAYLAARQEDIVIIKSPVGLPGRAIRNKFVRDLERGVRSRIECPYQCLSTCNVKEANFCIAQALLKAYFGDVDHGLIFCGQNAFRADRIITVKELIAELAAEMESL
jgi:nitronate monooxygenase